MSKEWRVWENTYLLFWTRRNPVAIFSRITSFNQQINQGKGWLLSFTAHSSSVLRSLSIPCPHQSPVRKNSIAHIWNNVWRWFLNLIEKNKWKTKQSNILNEKLYISNSETFIFQKERWIIFLDLEEVCRLDSSQACSQVLQWADFRRERKHFSSSHYFFCYLQVFSAASICCLLSDINLGTPVL